MVLLSMLGAVAAEVRAEPMLLLEIHQMGGRTNLSLVGQPIYMAFSAQSAPGMDPVRLESSYNADDVRMTFNATPEIVDGIEFALRQATGRFSLTCCFIPQTHSADELWRTDWEHSDISIQQFVPRRGDGLNGYDLTSVTQTIDNIEYIQQGQTINSQQAHTIRLYGQVVPEPTSIVLLLSCLAFVSAIWRF
jgi:hypothetical protein